MVLILLDVDETLVVEEESVTLSFLTALAPAQERHGLDLDELHQTVRRCARDLWRESPAREWCLCVGVSSWEGLSARFEGDSPEIQSMRSWVAGYRNRAWKGALAEHGIHDEAFAAELAARFIEERDRHHVPFPESAPVLTRLKKNYELGVLTNGLPRHQRRKLEGAGLAPFFETVVVSGDHGVGKPDKRIFEIALEVYGAAPGEVWMVGDNLEKDIGGAQAAGLRTIWVNRAGRPRDAGVEPDAEVTDLSELEGIVDWPGAAGGE